MATDLIVAKVDQARALLAHARDAGQAKQVADLARAAEVYARRQKLSEECIAYATSVKVDALTLMGEFLKAKPTTGAGPGRGHKGESKTNSKGELVFGLPPQVTPKESSNAQALVDLKVASPDLHEKVRQGKVTVSKAVQEVRREKKRKALAEKAKAMPANGQPCPWEVRTGDCGTLFIKAEERPNLIFADPPYNIGIDYGEGPEADRMPDEVFVAFLNRWIACCHTSLADDGTLWVLIGDEYAAEVALLLKGCGFRRRAWIKWYETFGVCNSSGSNFSRCSRHLFYCVKNPHHFTWNPDAVSRPSDRQTKYNDARANPEGKVWDDVWEIPRLVGTAAERIPDFPTQLPLALLRPIVGATSSPGDLVLDPFNGSGTTGVAAVESGRRYLGFEKNPRFAELATLRLKGICHGQEG